MLICKLIGCQFYQNDECTADLKKVSGVLRCEWDSQNIKKNSKNISENNK